MESTAVQAYETEGRWALDNGESRLEVDPTQGGRLIQWDYTAGGQTHRLMDAPGARVSAGPVALAAVGQAPEARPTLGPASPSGLGDHFLPLTVAQRDFALGQARELGTFAGAAFSAEVYPTGREAQTVALRSVGGIRGAKRLTPVTLYKRLTLGRAGGEISAHYRIENRDEKALQIYFGVEFCFALSPDAAAGGPDFPAYEFDGRRERGGYGVSGVAKEITSVALLDPQPGVTVRMGWEWAANVWVCPAPAGATGPDQRGVSVMAVWDLRLPPDDNWAVNIWLQPGVSGPVPPLDPALVERVARFESEDVPWKNSQ